MGISINFSAVDIAELYKIAPALVWFISISCVLLAFTIVILGFKLYFIRTRQLLNLEQKSLKERRVKK